MKCIRSRTESTQNISIQELSETTQAKISGGQNTVGGGNVNDLSDAIILNIAGGSVWSAGDRNQNTGTHQGRHDTGGYVPTT